MDRQRKVALLDVESIAFARSSHLLKKEVRAVGGSPL